MGKYYAVRHGKQTGIVESWDECKALVHGVAGAEYKSFKTRDEAQRYMEGTSSESRPEKTEKKVEQEIGTQEEVAVCPDDDTMVAYIDGSYNTKTKVYGYGAVIFYRHEKVARKGSDSRPEYAEMRNVSGELIAAGKVIELALKIGVRRLDLYYDYEGIEKWPTRKWKANKDFTQRYAVYVRRAMASLDIRFFKVEAHTGDRYNEEADQLAKQAVGLA